MRQNLYAKRSRIIKEKKYFNCKSRRYTIFNCMKKAKVFTIKNISNSNNIENII